MVHIFSPHIDDAFLSIGGCILNWQEQKIPVRVYNVFTVSDWTTPGALSTEIIAKDVNIVTALRREEEIQMARRAGYDFECWGLYDNPLRSNFSVQEHEHMLESLRLRIGNTLNFEDRFFFPLGIMHDDHVLIAQLAKTFLRQGYRIFFYEDLPYMVWGDLYTNVLANRDAVVRPHFETIDATRKNEFLRIYASQIRAEWFDTIASYSYNSRDNCFYERFWEGV